MEPYYGICPTCGAYMGRGDGNQCRSCHIERFAGIDTTPRPADPRERWVVSDQHNAWTYYTLEAAKLRQWPGSTIRRLAPGEA